MDKKSLLQRLVETESPSHQKDAVDRVGAIVAEQARILGAQVEVLPNVAERRLVLRLRACAAGVLQLRHVDLFLRHQPAMGARPRRSGVGL